MRYVDFAVNKGGRLVNRYDLCTLSNSIFYAQRCFTAALSLETPFFILILSVIVAFHLSFAQIHTGIVNRIKVCGAIKPIPLTRIQSLF